VQVVAVAWLVALVLLAFTALSYVRDARQAVESELDRTRDEAEALERFRRQVTRIDTSQPAQSVVGAGAGLGVVQSGARSGGEPPDKSLRRVREAYRETVMAVPHFEEDYEETLEEHLAAEFGEEVAHSVTEGSQLSPQLRSMLVELADEGRERRRNLGRALEDEIAALDEYEDRLADVERRTGDAVERPLYQRSFPELYRAWHALEDLEEECEQVLACRQSTIQTERVVPTLDRGRESFHGYLYGELPVSYPVLSAGADVIEDIRETRREVTQALTRIV
jgi:hypothetical protein